MARVMSTQRPAVMMILSGSRRLVLVTLGVDRVIEGSSLYAFAVGQFSRHLHHRRVISACSSRHARPAPAPVGRTRRAKARPAPASQRVDSGLRPRSYGARHATRWQPIAPPGLAA